LLRYLIVSDKIIQITLRKPEKKTTIDAAFRKNRGESDKKSRPRKKGELRRSLPVFPEIAGSNFPS